MVRLELEKLEFQQMYALTEDVAPTLFQVAVHLYAPHDSGDVERRRASAEQLLRTGIDRLKKPRRLKGIDSAEAFRSGMRDLFELNEARGLLRQERHESAYTGFGWTSPDTIDGSQWIDFADPERKKYKPLRFFLDDLAAEIVGLANDGGFAYPRPDTSEADAEADEPIGEGKPPRSGSRLPWRLVGVGAAVVLVAALAGGAALIALGDQGNSDKEPTTTRAQPKPRSNAFVPPNPLPVDRIFPEHRVTWDYSKYNGNTDCHDSKNPAAILGRCGPDRPVLNSFINLPWPPYDERRFFSGHKKGSRSTQDVDPILDVTSGSRVLVLHVYVSNDARLHPDDPSYNSVLGTRVKIQIPGGVGTPTLELGASIEGSNARYVWNTVNLVGRAPFKAEYIPGTAKLLRDSYTYPLGDEIVSGAGALVGVNVMNGTLPPGNQWEFAALVEIEVRVVPEPAESSDSST